MGWDANGTFYLVVKLFAKLHLNHLITISFNNIGRVLAIVKLLA
jgi:hypothetical protein